MNILHKTEVIVIGGGAVGCSIAYQLARRGKDVTLVDKAEPGAGPSTKNFGLVWVHTKEPHTYMELSLHSSLLWPKLVAELGEDVDLLQTVARVHLQSLWCHQPVCRRVMDYGRVDCGGDGHFFDHVVLLLVRHRCLVQSSLLNGRRQKGRAVRVLH